MPSPDQRPPSSQAVWPTRSLLQCVDGVLVGLVLGSLMTAWLGEHRGDTGLGSLAIGAVLLLSGFKGFLIAWSYMELRHAPRLWRVLVLGWLLAVLGLIAVVSIWP